jgi:hypothetical protein
MSLQINLDPLFHLSNIPLTHPVFLFHPQRFNRIHLGSPASGDEARQNGGDHDECEEPH